ncbi:MAG: DNA translocase FtsK 4TM domain-containing protein [Bacteroidales bacterium]|nr:DNA translocase FtsK 4TM domain-containing protein [Bacteroidales bacterium]
MILFSKYWERLSERKQAGIRFFGIALLLLFTVTLAVSVTSYVFTWKQDQSLVTAPAGTEAANAAASTGFSLGRFLVTDSFGLAAFCIVAFFVAWCVKLLWKDKRISLRKWFYGMFTLAFLLSWILALVGMFAGWETLFCGGLGGRAASAFVQWMVGKVGEIIAILILIVLAGIWLYCMSARFSNWLMGKKEIPGQAGDDVPEPSTVIPGSDRESLTEPASVIPGSDRESHPEPIFVTSQTEEPEVVKAPRKPREPRQPKEDPDGITVITDDTLDQEVKEPLKPIDNRLDPPDGLPKYKIPPLTLLGDHLYGRHEVSQDELSRNNNKIRATLASYRIQVRDVTAIVGPTVTLYKVYPAPGVKIAAIKQLQEDIGISLNAKGVRITTLSDSVGIEVANDKASIVPLKSLLNDPAFRESKAELPVAIGYTISQQVKVFDLADAPHLLVAGATKQGKSVGLNVIVASLLYAKHPSELKFVFVDPKMVEFSAYGKLLHHYLAVLPNAVSEQEEQDRAIVKNAKDAAAVLQSLCVEMDARYELLSKGLVNNIKLYNAKWKEHHLRADEGHHFLPYIVVVIDEYADLTMSVGAGPESKAMARSITTSVIRLAQKGRAAGLHVILATQRPTVDVITGLIKANFPMRIAFRVTSRIDSATILDQPGADKLIGRGDMLLYSGVEMERVQCAFISNDEIVDLTKAVGEQIGYQKSYNTPYYLPEPAPTEGDESGSGGMVDMKALDERFEEAARMIVLNQRGSTSDLQRRLGMGYAKAGRVMDQLEAAGIVGPQNGAKPREVLVKDIAELEEILAHFMP